MLLCSLENLLYDLFHFGNFGRNLLSRNRIITCMDFLNICFTLIKDFLHLRIDPALLFTLPHSLLRFLGTALFQSLLRFFILSVGLIACDKAGLFHICSAFRKPVLRDHIVNIFFDRFYASARCSRQIFKTTICFVSQCFFVFMETFQSSKTCASTADHPDSCKRTDQRHNCGTDTSVSHDCLQDLHRQKPYRHASGKNSSKYDQ